MNTPAHSPHRRDVSGVCALHCVRGLLLGLKSSCPVAADSVMHPLSTTSLPWTAIPPHYCCFLLLLNKSLALDFLISGSASGEHQIKMPTSRILQWEKLDKTCKMHGKERPACWNLTSYRVPTGQACLPSRGLTDESQGFSKVIPMVFFKRQHWNGLLFVSFCSSEHWHNIYITTSSLGSQHLGNVGLFEIPL